MRPGLKRVPSCESLGSAIGKPTKPQKSTEDEIRLVVKRGLIKSVTVHKWVTNGSLIAVKGWGEVSKMTMLLQVS